MKKQMRYCSKCRKEFPMDQMIEVPTPFSDYLGCKYKNCIKCGTYLYNVYTAKSENIELKPCEKRFINDYEKLLEILNENR